MALQASFSLSSSSSSTFSYAWKYHVFLSFRGADTRYGFTGHLYRALEDKGIRSFIDKDELERGEVITPSLMEAIEESRIAIPVFSKSYASSAFCLDELVKIMECVHGNGRLVLPVFYDVEPSEVRHQIGSYKGPLAKHEERHGMEKVQRWRGALRQAADLSGDNFKIGNEYECDLIEKIVKEIFKRISRVPLHVANYPVGLEYQVLQVNRLLNDGSEGGVNLVGIYGIGGIGKTTLARAVYNSIADQFDHLCFLEDLSNLSAKHGLAYIQNMLLSKILGENDCNLESVGEGTQIIKERFKCTKILLVLDNIDKREQLNAFIGRPDWFGSGSKVIVTTRDKHLLTSHEVKKVYEVKILDKERAIELFTWMAFKTKTVEPRYMDILKRLVTYASGLPLALEVIGSSMIGRNVGAWISAVDAYERIPNGDLLAKLKLSFDALYFDEKDVFLDIACCFNGYELKEVVNILHAHYNLDPKYAIQVLVEKSLIKINNMNVITLHDLIQDMGREIVRLESPWRPGARSRLWLAKDIVEVLQKDKGSWRIEMIHLDVGYDGDVIEWDGLAFKKMQNLKTLIFRKGLFSQGSKYFPNSLRVLKWEICSLEESLLCYFHPKYLVILELPRQCFDSVQWAKLMEKMFENMRVLILDQCERIKKIPNLSGAPKLEELSFARCKDLIEIDESVGFLDKLKRLNAEGCSQLRSLPHLLLPSLEKLDFRKCSSLESFPEILGKMESMRHLTLSYVPIKKLPYSFHNLTRLQSLYLWHCGIVELPSSIMLPEVESLWFADCEGLLLPNQDEGEEQVSTMPYSNTKRLIISNCNISEEFIGTALPMFPRLQYLSLSYGNFRSIPKCLEEFQFLRELDLYNCEKLEEIRGIPPSIEELFVVGCTSLSPLTRRMLLSNKLLEEGQNKMLILPGKMPPKSFEHWRWGKSTTFWFPNKFPAICFGACTPSLQEHQCLSSINDQHNLEGCESVDKAKGKGVVVLASNNNAGKDNGKNPFTEKLSMTKAMSGSYESSIHSENVDHPVNSLIEIQPPSPHPLDPLAELERLLLESYDLSTESSSPTAASSSETQTANVGIILQNLEPLLDNPLESMIADGEIKHQILDSLSKLGQLEDHIPIPLQSIIAQVKDFYEDLIQSFPSIQQTLIDYSCLEATRSKFLENVKQAKVKQAQIDAKVLRGKVQVEELDAEIADLEIKMKAVVEKRNELQLAIKNGEAERNKISEDASGWLLESTQVVEKIRSSKHAYRDAQNSKARLEGQLATLKAAFAANKP